MRPQVVYHQGRFPSWKASNPTEKLYRNTTVRNAESSDSIDSVPSRMCRFPPIVRTLRIDVRYPIIVDNHHWEHCKNRTSSKSSCSILSLLDPKFPLTHQLNILSDSHFRSTHLFPEVCLEWSAVPRESLHLLELSPCACICLLPPVF